MNDKQIEALDAATKLFDKGAALLECYIEYKEAMHCYRTLFHYILNSTYQSPVSPIFQPEKHSD